jgi:hypothetical protein
MLGTEDMKSTTMIVNIVTPNNRVFTTHILLDEDLADRQLNNLVKKVKRTIEFYKDHD